MSNAYRYGFNGKENDNEVKGQGNQQDYGMRIYDPRIGKFLSVDPITNQYPELTPYQFASNTPIQAIDLDGQEKFHYTLIRTGDGKPILKPGKVENFVETANSWDPTWTSWFKMRTTSVSNPRKEFIVHGTAPVTYGLDGNGQQTDNFTWTFTSEKDVKSAEAHGGPSNYGGWSWSNSDQKARTGMFIGVFNTMEAEGESPSGGLSGLGSRLWPMPKPRLNISNKIGADFEALLVKKLGGTGSFTSGGRELDGAFGNVWYEAKGGNFWENVASKDPSKWKSTFGQKKSISNQNGKIFQVYSEKSISQEFKDFFKKKGIEYFENVKE